ncbi:TetR/AcrR family transcriptional regulator [Williamsia sterculiae]|uniref:Transcriptional regulator, TetR family n=1 Tax=Williamsia sterculiae TaxID=1344003 RepID=A0A1N7EXL1_9NOCA|nr:TetR/AcrR family transcriptional regulator [Williamsia sterculiae]SIR92806.1 transcriptional regulator, TetR family [Williamsia sterculiae]
MPSRPGPTTAARAAVAAAANATKSLPASLLGASGTPGKTDGRKQRWEQHKEQRRTEFIDGTLSAVRELGPDIGMDEIAGHIGVSKTVLYRYFTDRNDLNTAAMIRFIEVSLLPQITEMLTDDVDDFSLTKRAIAGYVNAVADDRAIYSFVTSNNAGPAALADSEKLVAQLVMYAMTDRLLERDMDTAGVETWSYALVGAIRLATHWWMVEEQLTAEQLIDHLTIMVWGAIHGVMAVGGSAELFNAIDHPSPTIRTAP